MTSRTPDQTSEDVGAADFAKALQELAQGERTATALENQLSAMEAKIEALLERAEKEQREMESTSQAVPSGSQRDDVSGTTQNDRARPMTDATPRVTGFEKE